MVLLGERKSWLGQSTGEVMDKARVTHSCSKEDHRSQRPCVNLTTLNCSVIEGMPSPTGEEGMGSFYTNLRGVFIGPSSASICTERRM